METNIQITDIDGNIIGSVGEMIFDSNQKKILCNQFILKGKDVNVAKFYADRTVFHLTTQENGCDVQQNRCIIADHSFCYTKSETSVADSVTVAYNVNVNLKGTPPRNEEDFEKWLEGRFVW